MRQALHIFKKDVRHLWFEIAVAVTLVAAFGFVGVRRELWLIDPVINRTAAWTMVQILLPLAWWTLIARAIHDETLPGDRQFWITRPYSWRSLLAAKALFILTFINLPMLLADAVIVRAYGFHPFGTELVGLLWRQVLLVIIFVLPIATLSALTAGFVQLMFAVLIPCVVALIIAIVAPEMVIDRLLVLDGADWVRTYYVFLVICVGASTVLFWQYATRRTTTTRSLAVAVSILAFLGMVVFPGSDAFKIQSWFSKQSVSPLMAHVDFDANKNWLTRVVDEGSSRVRVELPLSITELPPNTIARPEGFSVQLEASDGTVWYAKQVPLQDPSSMGQEFLMKFYVDDWFYRKIKDGPIKVQGMLYLTLFGNWQTAHVPFGEPSVPVPRVGLCAATVGANKHNYFLICTSAFRSPPVLVSYRFKQAAQERLDLWISTQPRAISYSPFPAEPGMSPVIQDFELSAAAAPLSEAMVITLEPLAYIHRSFEIVNLRLRDSQARPAAVLH
jgi:hypothetical protein